MRRPHLLLLLTIGLILGVSRSAHGSPITINYTASVTSSNLAGIPIGNIVTGSFTYETAGVDLDPSPNHLRINDNFISITAASGIFNWHWSLFSSGFSDVANDGANGDAFNLVGLAASGTSSNVPSFVPKHADLLLSHSGVLPVGPLTSDALPTALIFGDWPDVAQLRLIVANEHEVSTYIIRADFTSLGDDTTSPNPAVPEPGTLSLLGLGLVGLAKSVRRRRRV